MPRNLQSLLTSGRGGPVKRRPRRTTNHSQALTIYAAHDLCGIISIKPKMPNSNISRKIPALATMHICEIAAMIGSSGVRQ